MNQWRSPTAEKLYANDPRIQVRSRGTSPKARRKLTQDDLSWAHVVFVMEERHRKIIKEQFSHQIDSIAIYVLDIPDDYQFMDAELIDSIRESVESFLAE